VPKVVPGDTAWLLASAALVMFMTPGLALFYGGLVRAKNVLGIVMQSFVALAVVSVVWVLVGYTLAFGPDRGLVIGGLDFLGLKDVGATPSALAPTVPASAFMAFQLMFAIITPALITGAFAERMKFSGYLIFLGLWSVLVYAPLAHWVWGGGFLGANGVGAIDFAGGTVVHINSGIAGLVGAILLGRRTGYGKELMPPHSLTLSMAGAAMLWVGWFGFNAGSNLEAIGGAPLAMINSFVATAAAALSWMFVEWLVKGKPSLLGVLSGCVAGLVAVTPASGYAGPMGALVLGLIAGVVCLFFCTAVKNALGYDDAFDVFGVHCIGGIIGAILTGILVNPALGGAGIITYEAIPPKVDEYVLVTQVMNQIWAVVITLVWSGVGSLLLFKVVDILIGLRAPVEKEREGLDINDHGERAYTM